MNFFYLKKKCFVLKRSRFLCFWEIRKFQNLWCHHRHYYILEVALAYFFWILSNISMKFGQILAYLKTNISNMFLAQSADWKLVQGSFMVLMKWQYKKISQILAVDIYHLHFSIKHWKRHNWLSSNWSRLLNCKGPETQRQPSKSFRRFQENIALAYVYQVTKFGELMGCGSKICSKMHRLTYSYSSWCHRSGKSWDG